MSKSPHKALTNWGIPLFAQACSDCQHLFYLAESVPQSCPLCLSPAMSIVDNSMMEGHEYYLAPPEGLLPPSLSRQHLANILGTYRDTLSFPPDDMALSLLMKRLVLVYLPIWWVDAHVSGEWQAEMGIDYKVISHREHTDGKNWKTQEQQITKTRWEQRLGTIDKKYENTPAPAMEKWDRVLKYLGNFPIHNPLPYSARAINKAFICLPTRVPADAWPDAELSIQKSVARECMYAAKAQHSRNGHTSLKYSQHKWSQLLVPVFSTWYEDESGKRHAWFIHGVNGNIAGKRQLSIKKARNRTYAIATAMLIMLALAIPFLRTFKTDASFSLIFLGVIPIIVIAILTPSLVESFIQPKDFNESQPDYHFW